MTREERKRAISDEGFGETLRKRRPQIDFSEYFKDAYFTGSRSNVSFLTPELIIVVFEGQQYQMIFESCINDAEKFWISMFYIRHGFRDALRAEENFPKYFDFVAKNAVKFNQEAEVAKLILSE